MNNSNKCPGCPHHCNINNLQCSKGRALCSGNTETIAAQHKEHTHHPNHFAANDFQPDSVVSHPEYHWEHPHHPHHPHHGHFHHHKMRKGHMHHRPHFAMSSMG